MIETVQTNNVVFHFSLRFAAGVGHVVADLLVSQHVPDEIQDELECLKKHNDALRIFERHGIRAYSQALTLLDYKVNGAGWIRITLKF